MGKQLINITYLTLDENNLYLEVHTDFIYYTVSYKIK